MSMALFQHTCTEVETSYETYLDYKANRQATATQNEVLTLSASNLLLFFCHHCRFVLETFMLWLFVF